MKLSPQGISLRRPNLRDFAMLISVRRCKDVQEQLLASVFSESALRALFWVLRSSFQRYRIFRVIRAGSPPIPVGFVVAFKPKLGHQYPEIGIALHPDFQNQGIGPKALEQFLNLLRESQFEVVQLVVRNDNLQAIQVYKSAGFRVLEAELRFYFRGSSMVSRMAICLR